MSELAAAEQQQVTEVGARAQSLVGQAHTLQVRTPEEAQAATGFLSAIAKAKREAEKARKFIVDPMNQHVKRINDSFKERTAPLAEADRIAREKVLAYQQEAERKAREEQERIDRKRREAEANAEAERQKAVEEAQAAERAAREAEEHRQAGIAAGADARRAEIAQMGEQELLSLCDTEPEAPDALMAAEQINARTVAREAQERATQAEQAAEEARQREIAAKSAPATAVAAPTALVSTSGSASARKRWVAEVVHVDLVPRQYLVVDQAALNAAVRSGAREIPGVLIEQRSELSVRAR
jgi:hypothetical protein